MKDDQSDSMNVQPITTTATCIEGYHITLTKQKNKLNEINKQSQ